MMPALIDILMWQPHIWVCILTLKHCSHAYQLTIDHRSHIICRSYTGIDIVFDSPITDETRIFYLFSRESSELNQSKQYPTDCNWCICPWPCPWLVLTNFKLVIPTCTCAWNTSAPVHELFYLSWCSDRVWCCIRWSLQCAPDKSPINFPFNVTNAGD